MPEYTDQPILAERFDDAIEFFLGLHRNQTRKTYGDPFAGHLLQVAGLVIEAGGDEDTVIAALGHDAIEDQGGDATRRIIYQRYGQRVGQLIDECTETDAEPKPPWRERKELYLAHLLEISDEALLIAFADKLHFLRSMTASIADRGPAAWLDLNADPSDQAWWLNELATFFLSAAGRLPRRCSALVQEFMRLADALIQTTQDVALPGQAITDLS